MLIWASTLQRPLFACLWKSMQKYILNGYCIRDERHFWCFPQLSSRDLSRPGNGIPLLSIFILHRVRHRYAARKTRFLTKFCKLVVYLLFFFFFFLNVYRFPSKTPPRLKFLPFHPIYFQYIYLVFHDERISNCQSNMSITITPPPRSFSPSAFYLA